MRELRRLSALWCPQVLLPLLRAACHCGVAYALPCLVGGMVEQSSDVMYEKRIEHLGDFFLVREIQRAIERYPVSVSDYALDR